MGLSVRAFTRQHIVAIAVGVLVAGTPLIAFNFWLSGVIDRQGQVETDAAAKRMISLGESRIGEVMRALDDLAARGVKACDPVNAEAMQRAAFVTTPIKEVAIVGPEGRTLCSHFNLSPAGAKASLSEAAVLDAGQRRILSSERLSETYAFDVLNVPEGGQMVRLRRLGGEGANDIAAMMSTTLFLPQATSKTEQLYSYINVKTRDGITIGQSGERPADTKDIFEATRQSSKLGFTVNVMTHRGRTIAGNVDLKWLGLSVTGIVLLILITFGLMVPKNLPDNPVTELQRALKAGEFVPYYQPIVDIQSGKLRGAEVLVRWRKADGTLVLPGSFIPLAESSGLIRAMTFDLMRRASVEVGAAIGQRPALKISFNFAGALFSDESIVKDVNKTFIGGPMKMSQVVLEVTERDPIENFTLTRQVIAALQGLGVRIAIDDVGTGHSGLSYMLKLGVDIIKIDKMFVDAIGTDRNSTTIVETLVDLAHNMRMDVVAEGVENFEQVMHLRNLGIRSAQGYVFAPPLPGSSFLKLVEAMDTLGGEAGKSLAVPQKAVAA
ncbi:MAG: EAL domain-containing protein [Pseudolabrys sp.]|nr:EAL domain-containing protein [Pseudolabrys sp.]